MKDDHTGRRLERISERNAQRKHPLEISRESTPYGKSLCAIARPFLPAGMVRPNQWDAKEKGVQNARLSGQAADKENAMTSNFRVLQPFNDYAHK